MESELGALLESLRTGANRLQADLTLLEGNMGELHDQGRGGRGERTEAVAEAPRRREVPAPAPPRESPRLVVEPEPVDDIPEEKEPTVPEPEPEPIAAAEPERVPEPEPEPEPATASGGDEDVEGARLIALNMALNGTS